MNKYFVIIKILSLLIGYIATTIPQIKLLEISLSRFLSTKITSIIHIMELFNISEYNVKRIQQIGESLSSSNNNKIQS